MLTSWYGLTEGSGYRRKQRLKEAQRKKTGIPIQTFKDGRPRTTIEELTLITPKLS